MEPSILPSAKLYRAFLRSDAALDGRVWVGVRTTGIYCLPSCRARKPKPQNVHFFATRAEAERHGFRPCRKCRPEVQGGRRALEQAALRRWLAVLGESGLGCGQLARAGGVSASRLYRMFRRHTGHGPRRARAEQRLRRACEALRAGRNMVRQAHHKTVAEVAYAAGFESLATFYRCFRRSTGTTPTAYRNGNRRER